MLTCSHVLTLVSTHSPGPHTPSHSRVLTNTLKGFTRTLKHLDDHEVTLTASGVTRPGDYHYIKGEGMPLFDNEHKRGDLWVQYAVAFPAQLSDVQKATAQELLKGASYAPPNSR